MLVQMCYQVQLRPRGGPIGSAWFIQLRGGNVAHLTAGCLDPSGAEARAIALARDLFGRL